MNTPFNTPLETGIRSLAVLDALFPAEADLQRLVTFDYIVVHSGDAGGPISLHPPLPLRSGELLVRRRLIERGLLLMESRGLTSRFPRSAGFFFRATERSSPFLDSLQCRYALRLRQRAVWAAKTFGEFEKSKLGTLVRSFLDEWTLEFQPIETSSGTR